MNRQSLWEQLDAIRPGSADLAAPEMASAARVLLDDESIRREFDRRRAWDARIRATADTRPVPSTARERLLDVLAADSPAVTAAPRLSRRRWLAVAGATAAGLATAGFATWFGRPTASPLSLADLRGAAADLLAGQSAPDFDGNFEPELPTELKTSRVRVSDRSFGLLPDEAGRFRVAALPFVAGRRGVHGLLLVSPADRITEPPAADSLFDYEYGTPADRGVETAAWTQQNFVYVCAIQGSFRNFLGQLDGPTV